MLKFWRVGGLAGWRAGELEGCRFEDHVGFQVFGFRVFGFRVIEFRVMGLSGYRVRRKSTWINCFTEMRSCSEEGPYVRLIVVASLNSRLESNKEEEGNLDRQPPTPRPPPPPLRLQLPQLSSYARILFFPPRQNGRNIERGSGWGRGQDGGRCRR